MKNRIAFLEIPTVDFARAVKFYQTVLGEKLAVCDCSPTEKMAIFEGPDSRPYAALSWSADFHPSKDGVLVSFSTPSIETALAAIVANGGKPLIPKTKIEADGMGYFATFTDSEGNTIGLYAEK